jgi:hypothetical protein
MGGVMKKQLPELRRPDRVIASFEQCSADGPFEFLDAAGEGRLSQMQDPGGPDKALLSGKIEIVVVELE